MSGWPQQSICSLGKISTGYTPKTSEQKFWDGEIPFITPSELNESVPIISAPRSLSEAGAREARLLQEGTVMVCCIGSLGKVGIAGRTVSTNQQINSIEFDTRLVYPKFGYYACRLLKPKLETMAPATTLAIVSKSKFESLKIPVPPLSAQHRIADILDRAEALRAKRRMAIAQLDTLIQSIFIEMFGDPATNPKGWKRVSICDIGEVITGNTPPRENLAYYGTAIEWIKSDNINTPYYYLTNSEEYLSELGKSVARTAPAGSILVTCIAGSPSCIGNAAMTDREVAFNQQINALVPSHGNAHFLYAQILCGKRLIQKASTEGMKGMVSKSRFENIVIIFPPIDLQDEFARRAITVERLRSSCRTALAKLDELFASLQYRAFWGEL